LPYPPQAYLSPAYPHQAYLSQYLVGQPSPSPLVEKKKRNRTFIDPVTEVRKKNRLKKGYFRMILFSI
jgi:hypothetical protein